MNPSMMDRYDCYQNTLVEIVNGVLKQEFLPTLCKDMVELKQLVKESISIYNNMRPHLSFWIRIPNEVHKKSQLFTQLA